MNRPLNPADFDALTFDCYGTLIDWERGILDVLRPWARRESVEPSDDELLAAFAHLESPAQAANPRALYPDILRDVMRGLGRRFGAFATDDDADALARSVGDWPPFPDTGAALRALGRDRKLVILSNVDRASIARSIERIGVPFDAVITAEDVGSYKPAHGHFRRAFEALGAMGVPRERILHVAQSLHHDHAPAKALGMKTVWVDRRRGKPGGATPAPADAVTPDLTVASLEELARRFD